MQNLIHEARWIWHPQTQNNQYLLFVKEATLEHPIQEIPFEITAAYFYKLYINGAFIQQGPVFGDPAWCQYDHNTYIFPNPTKQIQIAVICHHVCETYLHYLIPSRGGFKAGFQVGEHTIRTDETWYGIPLPMWNNDVPDRGWALEYMEDYDARKEPPGWQTKQFPTADKTISENPATIIPASECPWKNETPRLIPDFNYSSIKPVQYRLWKASAKPISDMVELSAVHDSESLSLVQNWQPYDPTSSISPAGWNAMTLDLGKEKIGYYTIEIDAPEGIVIELSGAERLRDGRPWISRKGGRYSLRYTTRQGTQRFESFGWSGFRYIHVIFRTNQPETIILSQIGCVEKRPNLGKGMIPSHPNPLMKQILDLCSYTLHVGAQEHLIDCPTREQAQYWGDALFIAMSIWKHFGNDAYLKWYLECYIRVPLRPDHQISCTYPGEASQILLDYSLIPVLGQSYYKQEFGVYYKPSETLEKALLIKQWYERHLNEDGLVSFDFQTYFNQELRNFIDHPGIGWHDFPHPGIDRNGVSCGLNLFYYGFVRVLFDLATELNHPRQKDLQAELTHLATIIPQTFYDGTVYHDALLNGALSEGTSWQTNGLAVYFDLLTGDAAQTCLRIMLDGYDRLCRCSPYFHFYFLPALRKAGMEQEAEDLILREWKTMIDEDATTTWEGFFGDAKDSLCHPWSTAPLLFLLEKPEI
jgi:alpha-L-rhamnosidase